jgi:hypothetical protein
VVRKPQGKRLEHVNVHLKEIGWRNMGDIYLDQDVENLQAVANTFGFWKNCHYLSSYDITCSNWAFLLCTSDGIPGYFTA